MNRDSLSHTTYKQSGVDIDAGNRLVELIKPAIKNTHRPEVLSSIGGFSGLCEIPHKYTKPVLVSATDGVGTKLRLAIDYKRYDTVGIDLVAMCVNDLVVCGAEPLQFLDYFATGKLEVSTAQKVIEGIAVGCKMAGCALIGGETAEMPDMYSEGDFDIAGFCQGVVEKDSIISGDKVAVGDVVIGLPSSGLHSNGYSLVRKILRDQQIDIDQKLGGKSLIDLLLEPTKIYVKPLLQLMQSVSVHACSHITGGGLLENIPRVVPSDLAVQLDSQSWKTPEIIQKLVQWGNIADAELYRVFNCGIGMVVIVSPQDSHSALHQLESVNALEIGRIVVASGNEKVQIS